MQQRILGNSGLRVSALGLGTATWGAGTRQDEAGRILTDFLDAGGNLVDASPLHGGDTVADMLGAVIAKRGVADELVLSVASGIHPERPVGRRVDCSRKTLQKDLDDTLGRLGVEHIDLWSPGYWDGLTPPEEVADTLEWAVRTGKVRYAGLRGYSGWQAAVTHAAADRIAPVFAQHEYSLLQRSPEAELLPASEHLGLGFIGGAPLAQGVLTAKYQHIIPEDSRAASEHADAEVQDYLDTRGVTVAGALTTAAKGLGVSAAVAAISWARDRPGVTSILVGARDRAQLRENLTAEQLTLPPQICNALDDVTL